MTRQAIEEDRIWQELEFGSYRVDLQLWEEIASAAAGPVLELGAGAGRVTLHLAQLGHEVIAVERDAALAADLERRAEALPVRVVRAELGAIAADWLPRAPGAAIAPLHVIQELDPDSRRSLLTVLADVLPAGAAFCAVVVDESSFVSAGPEAKRLPDMREVDCWVFSSEPLWVQVGESEIRVRRLRERVNPEGEIDRSVHDDVLHRLSPEALEDEAAGFQAVERRTLRTGTPEADSIAVILERS